jgi:pimeloyl-ACP methyl ester carboxylesterase
LLGRLKLPVLFIIGDQDRTASVEGVSSLVAQLPDARMTLYADTGHLPFIERTKRFNADVTAFASPLIEADNDERSQSR